MAAARYTLAVLGMLLSCGGCGHHHQAAAAPAEAPTAPTAEAPTAPTAEAAPTAPAAPPAAVAPAAPAADQTATKCATPMHAAFDFWVGDWVVKSPRGAVAGTNRIEKAHRGCALIEHWTAAGGGSGTSVNYVDAARRTWVQHWVDAGGGAIDLEGNLQGAAMHLTGRYVRADGRESQLRGSWTPLPDGRVHQRFEESTDGGATWTLWFDGYYSRR
jgi:hypothetical protein